MGARWQGNCLWAVAMLVLSGWCHAQSVTPDVEYKKLIQVDTTIQPLGAHPFGEQVNLSTGELSFEETDVSLSGNGPLLQLSRSLSTTDALPVDFDSKRPFGDWELDIPRIETATPDEGGVTTWEVEATNPLQRCTVFGAPPYVPGQTTYSVDTWGPQQWWYGYHLIVPGQGNQLLLQRTPDNSNPLSPTMGGQTFPIVTKQDWMIGCGVTADDGGEGFLAIAPDGTRYTFAHLFFRPMTAMTKPGGTGPDVDAIKAGGGVHPLYASNSTDTLLRRDAFMYVTQVQDRFGNSLTYHYDASTGYLTSITASDGREIDVTYVSGSQLIQSVTAKATNVPSRTWTYSYYTAPDSVMPTLTGVTLPDGSAWSYNLGAFQGDPITVSSADCDTNYGGVVTPDPATGTITTPTGLTGTFAETPVLHGRSYVPKRCWGGTDPTQAVYFHIPNAYYQQSLTSETITGAGLPTETWTYSYSPANPSWTTDTCATNSTCATIVTTDVTDPGGNDTVYTFSNRFDATEGQLLSTRYYSGSAASGTLMRAESNTYANPVGGPWPTAYGTDFQGRDNLAQTTETAPLQQRATTQNGDTYTWQALAFDAYTQPMDVKRSNTIAGQSSIEETTTYLNDTNTWVLGLPQTVTNKATGEVEIGNTYNSLDELVSRARFGQTLMSYTWDGAGQLASFTDGNSHTTTLGNYYRGIPQSIGYPDGTSETLTVDDLGQITSITDPSGHTTGYSYDPIGRIAQISYPYDSSIDSAQWYPKVFTYAYVTSAERGVAANHWRRTVTQGSATGTTYFDADLRPVLDDTSNGNTDISTATGYDWRGLTTLATYPVAGSPALSALTTGTHRSYDALGRLTQSQQDSELGALTTTTAYLSGAREQVTDPKGNVTTTTYQVFDEPDYAAPIEVQAPTGITQTISRDVYGNPLSITQSGTYGTETDSVTKSFYYDSYHRLCRTVEPETGSTVMAYDGANNLAWSAEGQSISGTACSQSAVPVAAQTARTYDAMNRVLTIVPPSGTQSTAYTYDMMGRVHTTVSGIANQGFSYNSLGDLTGESLQVNGFSWALGYGYDAYGHRSTVVYPAGTGTSETVSYVPDAWGRPTQAGSYVTGVSYYPDGHVSGFTYISGASYVAEENTRQLLSNFSDGAGSALTLSEDLTYDADGNLTAVNDLASGLRTKSFGYDALNRLTSATASNLYGTESYTYDPINNLRTRLTQGQTLTYNYDASNKLTSITQGGTAIDTLTYNPQGDTTGQNSTTLAFDAKHQLTGLPGVESYSYDAAGRRVEKLPASGSPTYYFYNQAGQLMYQYEPATTTATDYIYLGTKLVGDSTTVNSQIVGYIDGVSIDSSNNATVTGWACSTGLAESISVDLYAGGPAGGGGTDIGRYSANQSSEAAVAAACDVSSGSYRYSVPLSSATRNQYAGQPIYVYGISPVGNTNRSLTNSGTYSVPALANTPAATTLSTPATSTTGSYAVSWGAVSTATSYTLQISSNGGSSWGAAYSGSATSLAVSGQANGTYEYRVEACNANGCGPWSGTATTVTTHPPAGTPSLSVPATSSTGSYTVSWGAVSTATSYTLQISSNGGSSWGAAYSGSATSLAVSGQTNGTYLYRVEACNAGGCGPWSGTATTVTTHPPASTPTLSVPATSSTGSYTVSWGTVSMATSYTLQLSTNGGSSWSTATSGNVTSWAASSQGTGSYTYRVEACNAGGCSAWSGTKTVSVLLLPAAPASVSVTPDYVAYPGGSWVSSWPAVSGATSYNAQRTNTGTNAVAAIYSGGTGTSVTQANVVPGTYVVGVQACNASGCSGWTNSSAVTVFCSKGALAVKANGVQPMILQCNP